MDLRRHQRLLRWYRRATVLALAILVFAPWQRQDARGLRHRWRPSLPAAEQFESQPMPRWHVDRG